MAAASGHTSSSLKPSSSATSVSLNESVAKSKNSQPAEAGFPSSVPTLSVRSPSGRLLEESSILSGDHSALEPPAKRSRLFSS